MNPSNPATTPIMPSYEPPEPVQETGDSSGDSENPATELIRLKLNNLYSSEPSAKEEVNEAVNEKNKRSKHQEFMYQLNSSGKSIGEIQTAWHQYYTQLPDAEKHQVWQEFYANQKSINHSDNVQPVIAAPENRYYTEELSVSKPRVVSKRDNRTVSDVKKQLLTRINSRQKLKTKQHFQSLIFGLGLGSLVVLVLLFSFFNERFIAPFITPSRQVSATPIIIDASSDLISDPSPKVIIPKINVEIPVVYNEPSVDEKALQKALERGVVHYATTPSPGEQGNVVIFGHSSNNIFNQGRYKFAFVLISRLDSGDLFYLTKDGHRYTYKVYSKKIVSPSAIEVLGPSDKADTATLITCDPPGTSINRLVVTGEQISPAPDLNGSSSAIKSTDQPKIIPSNAPSLWQKITGWF